MWATDPIFPMRAGFQTKSKQDRIVEEKTETVLENHSTGKMPVSSFANNELLSIQSYFYTSQDFDI